MYRIVIAALVTVAAGLSVSALGQAQSSRVAACSVLPKEEVKKHLPWLAILDSMPVEEEPVGAAGSSCNYPSVFIQVLPFSQGTMDAFRKLEGAAPVSGVGEEAYFRSNRNRYAELAVKSGARIVTFQANANPSVDAVRPGTLNLARAYIAKLH